MKKSAGKISLHVHFKVHSLVKLCENIAAKQVTEHLERNGKLPKEGGGAKPKRLTTTNIKALVNTIRKGLPDKQHFALGLYGLEDAYYRVDILTLVDKMMNCGVMVRWILSMLDTRRCKMSFGTWESDPFEVSFGLNISLGLNFSPELGPGPLQ